MPQEDISFKTADGVTLRGWFFKSDKATGRTPCLVMAHGFSATKEMDLNTFAEYFVSKLPISCVVYDNRGFGASDTKDGHPRQEIIPAIQISDYSDAITYAQMRDDVDENRIGIWGSSYSGGHVIGVGACDRRVKIVLCQVPMVNGWENFHRLIRPDLIDGLNQMFQADRHGRINGQPAGTLPVVSDNPLGPAALPTAESFKFFMEWESKCSWKNEVTVRSVEALREYMPSSHIHHIAPTPLLITVAENDTLCPTDITLEAFSRAREPKALHILPGGHFDGYAGPNFERNAGRQVEFLKQYLCPEDLPVRTA